MQHEDFIAVKDFRRWLDSQPIGQRVELSTRIMKVGEEFGEVVTAWIGAMGQNPRKGVTHTYDNVVDELADVAFTALVAIESLGLCSVCELSNVMDKALDRITAPEGDPR